MVGHDARSDPGALASAGLAAQPGPAGGDLGHHADGPAQAARRLQAAGRHAAPAALPGPAGQEASGHQDRGEGERG